MTELPENAKRFFQGENFAHVATISASGAVHVSPVWIDLEDGRPVFNTAIGRLKERHLRRDPRVTLTIQDLSDPYTYVEIVGRAELTDDGAEEHVDALAKRYMGVDVYPYREEGERRVKVYVDPVEVRGMLESDDD